MRTLPSHHEAHWLRACTFLVATMVISAVLALPCGYAADSTSPDLVLNGSFESGDDPGVSANIDAPNTTAVMGWSVDGGSIDYNGPRWSAGDGQRCLDLSGVSAGTISQVISNLVPGQSYRLSFLMAGNPEMIPPLVAVKRLRASIGVVSKEFSFNASGATPANMGWMVKNLDFTAVDPTELLSFQSLTDSLGGPALDQVSIRPRAPEEPVSPQGLVFNGSFELGMDPGLGQNINAPDTASIDGWSIAAGSIDYMGSWWTAGEGQRCLDLSGVSMGLISQIITNLVPGQAYRLSFLMAGNPELIPPLPAIKSLRASIGAASKDFSFNAAGHSTRDLGWELMILDFTADSASEALSFRSLTDGLGGAGLDQVSIVPVPISPQGLVFNGSFELGTSIGTGTNVEAPNATAIAGWSVDAGTINYSGLRWAAGDGARSVDLSGVSLGTISQVISNLVPSQAYRLTFLMAADPESIPPRPEVKRLRASVGATSGEFTFNAIGATPSEMGWTLKTLEFTPAGSTETLSFQSLEDALGGPALDRVAITPAPIVPSGLVANGSFELGEDPGISINIDAPNSSAIPGWLVDSGSIDYNGTRWAAADGQRCLDLSGVSRGTIRQAISNLVPGQSYRLAFFMAGNPEMIPSLPTVKRLRASIGLASSEYSFSVAGFSTRDMGWILKTLDFTASSPIETLSFQSLTDSIGGPALDNVSIIPALGPPVITVQPRSQEVAEGASVTLTVEAFGTAPLHYQWQFNGGPLSGATDAALVFAQVRTDQSGEYSVVVTNELGSTVSAVAQLTVTPRPTYDLGRDFALGANPNGAWTYGTQTSVEGPLTPLSYARSGAAESWEFAAGVLPAVYHNRTSETIVTDGGAGLYPPGSVWFEAGEDGTARNFSVIRFTVPLGAAGVYRLKTAVRPGLDGAASRDSDFHVVYHGVEMFGQFLPPNASASYSNDLALLDGETIDFLVGRGADGLQYGSILKINATLTWMTNTAPRPPVILGQPESQSAAAGRPVAFRVNAGGSLPLRFQWRFNGAPLTGETDSTLLLPQVQPDQAGEYSVEVANDLGSVTSAVAMLTVTDQPAYDLERDFSLGSNPNGVWSYGAKSTLGGALTLSSYSRVTTGADGLRNEAWEFTAGQWPAIYRNPNAVPIITYGGAGVYPPGAVWYAAGEDGSSRNFGAIRFAVPPGGAGLYRLVTTVYPGLEGTESQDSDFHVVWSGMEVFGQFLPPNTQTGFSNELALLEGDTIDFLIGRGADGKQWGSTLKIQAALTWLTNAQPQAPLIVQEPRSLTVRTGEVARFAVLARAAPAPAYQWYFEGAAIPGAVAPTFEVGHAQPADAGAYFVLASNPLGSVTSAVAILTVEGPPVPIAPAIVTQPASLSVLEGATVTFSVGAEGTPPLDYQWSFNGTALPGATASSLTLTAVRADQAGAYSVKVSNSLGEATSENAVLTVDPNTSPPTITRQPFSRTVAPLGSTAFIVLASGAPPLTYQWLFNETPLPGQTSNMLVITAAQEANAGTYSVVVSNAYGFAVSDEAVLTITDAFVAGTVNFANVGRTNALVFDTDGVTKLSGPDYRAELLAGAAVGTMYTVGPSVGFPFPGYFAGGTRAIPTVSAGQSAYVQVRVWDQTRGLTYEEAGANGGKTGASSIFTVVTGGAGIPPVPPAGLTGLSSFALTNSFRPAPIPLTVSPGERPRNGAVEWILTGPPSARCVIERSMDLENWSAVCVVRTTNGVARFSDPVGTGRAFYRARIAE